MAGIFEGLRDQGFEVLGPDAVRRDGHCDGVVLRLQAQADSLLFELGDARRRVARERSWWPIRPATGSSCSAGAMPTALLPTSGS